MAAIWAQVSLVGVLPSCSWLNKLDACENDRATEFVVNVRQEGWRRSSGLHAVSAFPNGQALAVFESAISGDPEQLSSEVRGTLLGTDGMRIDTCSESTEITYARPSSSTWPYQRLLAPSVAMRSDVEGTALLVYDRMEAQSYEKSTRTFGRMRGQVMGVFVDANGCLYEGNDPFNISDEPADYAVAQPEIVALPGSFVVMWIGYSGIDFRLRARVLENSWHLRFLEVWRPVDKTPSTGEPVDLLATGDLPAGYGAVALTDDTWALAWTTVAMTAPRVEDSVWLMALDSTLRPLTEPLLLHRGTSPSSIYMAGSPSLAFDGKHLFVTWTQADESETPKLYGAVFQLKDDRFEALSEHFRLAPDSLGSDGHASVTQLGQGQFLAAWDVASAGSADDRSGGSVRFTGFDATGHTPFLEPSCGERDFQLNSGVVGDQRFVSIAATSDHTVQAVWTDSGPTERNRRRPDEVRSVLLDASHLYSRAVAGGR